MFFETWMSTRATRYSPQRSVRFNVVKKENLVVWPAGLGRKFMGVEVRKIQQKCETVWVCGVVRLTKMVLQERKVHMIT